LVIIFYIDLSISGYKKKLIYGFAFFKFISTQEMWYLKLIYVINIFCF